MKSLRHDSYTIKKGFYANAVFKTVIWLAVDAYQAVLISYFTADTTEDAFHITITSKPTKTKRKQPLKTTLKYTLLKVMLWLFFTSVPSVPYSDAEVPDVPTSMD